MGAVIILRTDERTVGDAVEEIFERFHLDLDGKRVLIKPNLVSAAPPERAITTHPMVVKAVLEACRRRGADPVVGDNCLYGSAIFEVTGIAEACKGFYRSLGSSSRMCKILADKPYEVPISEAVFESDYIINLPKMKTHVLAGVTLCVKNMFGTIPGTFKAKLHALTGHAKPFTRFLVALYEQRPPDFNIIDGIVAMEGNGPTGGRPRRLNRLIAGPNGVEVDAVAVRMMGFENAAHIKTLEFAHQMGLGQIDMSKIKIEGEFETFEDFLKPSTYTVHLKGKKRSSYAARADEIFDFWSRLGSLRPRCDESRCEQCGDCESICPQNAIQLTPYPQVDDKRCISCFCCIEACLYRAMEVPNWEELQKERTLLNA